MKKRIKLLCGFLCIFPAGVIAAEIAAGVKLGTLGAGLNVEVALSKQLSTRGEFNLFEYSYEDSVDGVDYDADLKLQSFGALIDWHPGGGGFRITAGVVRHQNGVDLKAVPTGGIFEVGEHTYSGNPSINGTVDFRPTAPYLGLGWGNAFNKKEGWVFTFDVGVLFQGDPETELSAQGTAIRESDGLVINLEEDAGFLVDLAEEELNVDNDLDEFSLYPVVSFGVSYVF